VDLGYFPSVFCLLSHIWSYVIEGEDNATCVLYLSLHKLFQMHIIITLTAL
jgi:hypothetical protein